MKNLFFVALFAIVATAPAFASELQPEPELAGYVASDSVSNESGAVVQVGKFFGSLLKLPVSVGRDLFTGVKAGLGATSASGATGSGTAHWAPVEHRTSSETSGIAASKAESSSCKACGGLGPYKASKSSKSENRVAAASPRAHGLLAAVGSVASASGLTESYTAKLGSGN
jgi:hypothetical protein